MVGGDAVALTVPMFPGTGASVSRRSGFGPSPQRL